MHDGGIRCDPFAHDIGYGSEEVALSAVILPFKFRGLLVKLPVALEIGRDHVGRRGMAMGRIGAPVAPRIGNGGTMKANS